MQIDNIEFMNPLNGGKFSPNFYQWMKQWKPITSYNIQAWRCLKNNYIYVGFDDDGMVVGSKLWTILSEGRNADRACHMSKMKLIPDFWKEYSSMGRCCKYIDPLHNVEFCDNRWIITEDMRTCQWCGQKQYKHYREVKYTESFWSDDE